MLKKIGLCLSGGGARGAYQAGAINALDEAGVLKQISVFAGTSIGAANAAVLASQSAPILKEAWFHIPPHALGPRQKVLAILFKEKLKALELGFLSMDTFSSMLMHYIDEKNLKKHKVYVTISDGGDHSQGLVGLLKSTYQHYLRQEPKVIYMPLNQLHQDDALKTIIASCSIPLVFPSVKTADHTFYDGGVFDNIPVNPLIAEGCTEIWVIQLTKAFFFSPEAYPNTTIHEIKHEGSLGGIFDFSQEHIEKLYAWGYQDAQRFIKMIQ